VVGAVVLETLAARVEENLLGCHVVAEEKSGEDTGLLVDTLLAFGEIRDRVVVISTDRAHNQLKCLGCHAQRRKACGRAGHGRGAYIVLEEVIAAGAAIGSISNLDGN
jgi:hypothetical protein